MYKRRLIFLLLLLPCFFLPARAAEGGSIRVTLEAEAADKSGYVDLYRVADTAEEGYRLYELFGGGFVREEDARSSHLASWLEEMVWDQASFREYLDDSGSADFQGLTPGLYLLARSQGGVAPFLIPLPMNGEMSLHAYPQAGLITGTIPVTGDPWGPIPGIMGMALSGAGLLGCLASARKRKKT